MLLESICKCRFRIPLEILSFVDLKILKIGLEMAELAIPKSVPFGHARKAVTNAPKPIFGDFTV